MRKIHGKDVFLALDGEIVGYSTSCSLSVQGEFKEVAPRTDAGAREFLPDSYSWEASVDCLMVEDVQHLRFVGALKNRRPFLLCVGEGHPVDAAGAGGPLVGYKGIVYVAGYNEQSAVGSLASYTVQLRGSGPLDIVNDYE
jgi:hypothetical protein